MDWDILFLQNVTGVMVKSSQNQTTDRMAYTHADAAIKAGVWLGFYHWLDPIYSGKAQAEYMLKAINRYPYKAIAVDLEQWWSNWDAWYDARNKVIAWSEVPILTPTKINSCVAAFINYVKTARPDIDIYIYTRPSYIMEYCRLLYPWIGQYKLWYATYPFKTDPPVTCSWDLFRLAYMPAVTDIKYPSGYPDHLRRWDMWQFTGDKFTLPGFHSKMDINLRKSPDMPVYHKPGAMDRFMGAIRRLLHT